MAGISELRFNHWKRCITGQGSSLQHWRQAGSLRPHCSNQGCNSIQCKGGSDWLLRAHPTCRQTEEGKPTWNNMEIKQVGYGNGVPKEINGTEKQRNQSPQWDWGKGWGLGRERHHWEWIWVTLASYKALLHLRWAGRCGHLWGRYQDVSHVSSLASQPQQVGVTPG